MSATRVDLVREGVRATNAVVGPFELQLLRFEPGHAIAPFPVERPYVVVVLEGSVAKGFGKREWLLRRHSFATLPTGAEHTSSFGPTATLVLAVRGHDRHARALAQLPRRLEHIRAAAATAIGRRIVAELHAADACWPLAAEGLVLELFALAGRAGAAGAERRPAWLQDVRDRLHERAPEAASLSALAREAGVHPAHLARSFRRAFGVTVGDYARTLRLEWATTRLADEDSSLAEVAAGAGFADQSHFTRAFRRHTGVTPGRYRARLRV